MTSSSSPLPTLRVQINQIDYMLVPPGPLDNSTFPLVPIIRIYGPASSGQKACVHTHQVYPYFFIDYSGPLKARDVKRYTAKLRRSLDHAVALSLKRDPQSPKSHYVRSIVLVKGVHFYGFHSSYAPFLKIMVVDPACVSRIVTMLQAGTVMGTRFRTYESHLSYTLQFLSDFGLYGCGWIELGQVFQRCRNDVEDIDEGGQDDSRAKFPLSPHFRQSRMPLEVDTVAHQILNRHKLTARNLHHELEIPAPALPEEPLVLSVRELWEDERNRRRASGLSPSPEMPVDLSESSRGPGADWASEVRWWDEIRKRIERVQELGADNVVNVDRNWEGAVMSTFESVEVLWENEYRTWKPRRINEGQPRFEIGEPTSRPGSPALDDNADDRHNVDVDISILSNGDFLFESLEDENVEDGDDHLLNEHTDEDYFDEDEEDEDKEDEVVSDSKYSFSQPMADGALHESSDSDDPFQSTSASISPGILMEDAETLLETGMEDDADSLTHSESIDSDESDRSITPTPSRRRIQSESIRHDHIQLNSAAETDVFHGIRPQSSDFGGITKRKFSSRDTGSGDNLDEHEKTPVPAKRRKVFGAINLKISSALETTSTPVNPALLPTRPIRLLYTFYKKPIPNANAYSYSPQPPSASQLLKTLSDFDIPNQIYRAPYYSDEKDAPPRPREYAGLVYNLKGGEGIANLEEWETVNYQSRASFAFVTSEGVGGWEYNGSPPSSSEVKKWLRFNENRARLRTKSRSQIDGPTQANIYGLKITPPGADKTTRERQDMTIFSLEVFAPSTSGRLPNADEDELAVVCYTFQAFENEHPISHAIGVEAEPFSSQKSLGNRLELVASELELINRIVDIVIDLDPDIITGWDVQNSSWGYLASRARTFDLSVEGLISRAPPRNTSGSVQWETRHTTTFKVAGRHVLNLWRIMRSEVTLNIYTFENVAFHVLGRRVPKFKPQTLTDWYHSPVPIRIDTLIRHLSSRASMNLEILNRSEVVTKTAEFARVFGVDFYSVISRGSQFKVESFMFRLAKPESFVLISPSKADVGKQNAAECLPLIMEPQSALYTSPLVVLDFQSLYPSIMIAYNYCYSTCLGRVVDFQGQNKLGVVNLRRPDGLLEQLQDYINVAPNGMMYVKPQVRKGLLGRMLTELLDTRVMVKQAMKRYKHDKTLTRILNARQLGLKYIANVTYGYTSASFSGRMPAVEIADSIVQSGRETLEKAITLVNETKKWGAEVVYGDTDSMFIYLKGKTREQAFQIGHQIAESVTALNPSPIKLKFEKVYHPCVLMAKKRYVGFKYESVDDTEPVFDAKGIETVRRDGIQAQQKMTENCLKILFRTQNLSEVKEYCCDSWAKIMENRVSVQDFIFAKEVRMGTYSETGPPPPGVAVAAKRTLLDPSDEPQYGERVPYVIARGLPGSKLVDRAMDPLQFVSNPHARLDAAYYISRVLIPPLERIFNLVGADVRQWYNEMPKAKEVEVASPSKTSTQVIVLDRFNIDEHFNTSQCLICGKFALNGLCVNCWREPQTTVARLLNRLRMNERRLVNTHRICVSCTGATADEAVQCESLDCPWFFARRKVEDKTEFLEIVDELVQELVDHDGSAIIAL